jgi:subfamily B ATP-binding cassette protein MsbA
VAGSFFKSLIADEGSTRSLVRRLLVNQALVHWRLYGGAFALMALAAGCTSVSAYLFGNMINEAYVNRNFSGIVTLSVIVVVLFSVKGFASYGQTVMMARVSARIVADNQRAMYEKLLNEGLGFFNARHSTEFLARLTAGANSASSVINLLITAVGRDLFSVVGLGTVMVLKDPVL